MSIITASGISKSYGANNVLKELSFRVKSGDRIGIVGANGSGKTTLMKIIAGEISPDSGEIFVAGDLSIGHLRQLDQFPDGGTVMEEMRAIFKWQEEAEKELAKITRELDKISEAPLEAEALIKRYSILHEEFRERRGYSYKGEIKGILGSLAFSEDYYDKPVMQLSGGERTRLALAALLLRSPNLLLLDEPTNHLDIGSLKWLETYLINYRGTVIIISHDRYFLDRSVTQIFEIENGRLGCYGGSYSLYKKEKRRRYEEDLKRYEALKSEIEREEEMIRRFKERGTEKLAMRAASREKKVLRMKLPERPFMPDESISINFKENLRSGNDVVLASGLSMSFGEGTERRKLFRDVDLDIKRGDRICVVGPNGIGKTTLLRIILGQLEPDSGHVRLGQNVIPAYYEQGQQGLDLSKTVLDELHSSYKSCDRQELRNLLAAFLFKGDDVFKYVGDLAGGERARLSLLKLMMSGANLLVFDEPTNHLDISSKEVFEDALLSYDGTIIIVSHDRYLLEKMPTAIYELGPDGIEIYLGNYGYYEEKSAGLGSGRAYLDEMTKSSLSEGLSERLSEREKSRELSKAERTAKRTLQKQRAAEERKAERRLAEAEKAAIEAEDEMKRLEKLLCSPEVFSDPMKAAETAKKLKKSEEQFEKLYEIWLSLA